MRFEELEKLLKEDRIEKTPDQGYLCLLHNEGMIPALFVDGDAVLIVAGLVHAMEENRQMEAVIRSAVVHFDKTRAEGGEV